MLTITEFIADKKFNIDIDTFDLIYDIITIHKWIHITKKMVIEWLGYKESKNTMSDFYRNLAKNYILNIDYQEVDKNHELITNKDFDGNRKKYYIVSSKTLLLLLMKSKNIKSLRILEHFYYIYDLLFKYYEYQSIELKLEFTNELDKIKKLDHSKEYTIQQDQKYKILEEQNKLGFVYFVYEKNDMNYFKIGFTKNNLETRLSSLQTGNRRVLIIYKFIECGNPEELESVSHDRFKNCKIINEWYKITTSDIDNYILEYELSIVTKKINNLCV